MPALRANALYEGKYPLVSALSRPVIVEHLVASARRHRAHAVGHGCTGKGNDQVRFEVSSRVLAPDLDVLAPVRVWGLTRADCVELAGKWEIPIEATVEKLYSIDENMWGRAIECGVLENPWASPPEEPFTLTRNAKDAPSEPRDIVVGFEAGVPVSLDGEATDLVRLIDELGQAVGSYGWGRIDMVENRRVGIKSREVYECPASLALVLAHQDLEGITLERDVAREKQRIEIRVAELIYDGLWHAPLMRALEAFVDETQREVTGEVRLRLEPGRCYAAGPAGPARAVRPRPRDLRQRRRVPAPGLGRVRSAVGSLGGDVVAPARSGCGPVTTPHTTGQPLWHGRFGEGPADELLAFTVSLPFDQRLAADDLVGSRAHVSMLAHVGLLTDEERSVIHAALDRVEVELAEGTFAFAPTDEDIHTAIERRVTEIAGGHRRQAPHRPQPQRPGRARPAPVRAPRRSRADAPASTRCSRCSSGARTRRPKSRCPATPTSSAPSRSCSRTTCSRTSGRWHATSTGGATASSGPTCRRSARARWPARACRSIRTSSPTELGFARRFQNSLDAVSDRDFVAEALFVATMTQLHLSRIGEEIVLWSTEEFGFVRLADAYATGSSMLPQKKNPDIAELARGKAGRLIGDLTGLLATLKGLPLAYNRDLQEDKEPLFDALDTCALSLAALDRPDGHDRVRRGDDDRGRRTARSTRRPTSPSTSSSRARRSGKRTRSSAASYVRPSNAASRSTNSSRTILVSVRKRCRCSKPGSAVRRRTTPGGGGPEPVARQLEAATALSRSNGSGSSA